MNSKTPARPPKDQRYREKCFPGAENEVFNPTGGGYAPLPYISRELMSHLKPAELRVWMYLLTRGGPFSICYPTYEDIMRSGVEAKGTVSKAIKRLEHIGLIRSFNDKGTRRNLLRDPRLAVARLYELGEISLDELEEANDLLEKLKLPLIEPKQLKPHIVVPLPKKTAKGA